MRYVAAYLLAVLGGNESPSEGDLKKILDSVGVGYDAERASLVVSQLKGKSIDEVSFSQFKLVVNAPFYALLEPFYTLWNQKGFLLISGDIKHAFRKFSSKVNVSNSFKTSPASDSNVYVVKNINRSSDSPRKGNGEQSYTSRVYRTQKEFLDGSQEK